MKRMDCRTQRASALIIVLAMLVLLLGLVMAFFSSVTSDSGSASAFSSGVEVQKLSDTAVSLAASQIHYATSGRDAGGNEVSWASQPGAIRTFRADGQEGQIFKLYSTAELVTDADTFRSDLATEAVADAINSPAVFADLNAPVLVQDDNGGISINGVSHRAVYPIFDPGLLGEVEGLSLGGSSVPPAPSFNPATSGNPAPMAVRWLYILEDGSMVSPSGSGSSVTVAGANPTTNPIIGRIAFWADDETSKVNVNTAGEFAFWDTPRFNTPQEKEFGKWQPANNEFQRYPGHPATVSLATALAGLVAPVNYASFFAQTPRLSFGGSQMGTVAPSGAMQVKLDRLLATTQEFAFSPNRQDNPLISPQDMARASFLLTTASRSPETTLFDTPRISMWPVHADLASNPSSPYTTAFDRLAAFCSTIGNGQRFHFQRRNSDSATEHTDIPRNEELIEYLQNLTARPIPGYGGSLLGKYDADRDQILAQIFDYVRMTNPADDNLGGAQTSATGYAEAGTRYTYTPGRSGASGYRPGFGQVKPTRLSASARGIGRFEAVTEGILHFICTGSGEVSANPTVTSSALRETDSPMKAFLTTLAATRGTAANQPVLQPNERILQAAFYLEMTTVAQNWDGLRSDYQVQVTGLPGLGVVGATPVNPFPAGSNDTIRNSVAIVGSFWHYRLFGGTSGHRTLLSNRLPSDHANNPTYAGDPTLPPILGTRRPTMASPNDRYPFVSAPFLVDVSATPSLEVGPVSIVVEIRRPDASTPIIQTVNLNFPGFTAPLPSLETEGLAEHTNQFEPIPALAAPHWWGFRTRFAYAAFEPGFGFATNITNNAQRQGCVIRRQFDVVRSMVPRWGDNRLLAALEEVEAGAFILHPGSAPGVRIANSLSEAPGSHYSVNTDAGGYNAGTDLRRLVSGARHDATSRPDIPPDTAVTARAEATGDWDNGLALHPDGSWINKPDEGVFNAAFAEPYFTSNENATGSPATFFSPNRIIPSPGMFGSLPSRVRASVAAGLGSNNARPWETLLFRPQQNHPAATSPPDHLWMDLFWMPAVEPYAVSEPFSTAGKVNLNYQIVPFTSVRRSNAVRAALKGEKIAAVPTSAGATYKTNGANFRSDLNLDETNGTLRQFEEKFAAASGQIFRSATEICDIYLVPQNQNWVNNAAAESFWANHRLTGDNTRERPYTNIYGKITTRSNAYRVQLLRGNPNLPAGQWDESRGKVVAESRGSRLVERYIEPRDSTLLDFATNPGAKVSDAIRIRMRDEQRFAP